ncbi:short-chain fatty acid transporter, partial [Burkholderia multivorans]
MSAPSPSQQKNAAVSKGVMRPINRVLERWIPSALTFAIVLTLIVAILAFVLTGASPLEVVTSWGVGLSGLLEFMTQMCLILLLGHILANTGPVQALL